MPHLLCIYLFIYFYSCAARAVWFSQPDEKFILCLFACICFFSVLSHTWRTQLRCEFNNWDPYVRGAPVPALTGLPCRRSCLLTCPNLSLLLTFTYLLSIIFSLLAEFSRSLLPRPRRLLLLVNPFSGRGQAMQWCQTHILPMIREANISYNLIQTGNKTGPRHSHETNETWMWSIYIYQWITLVASIMTP